MSQWYKKDILLKDLPDLYRDLSGSWLLLKILQRNKINQPVRFELMADALSKDTLHDQILENGLCEDPNYQCLFVFADPHRPCSISSDKQST